MTTLILFGWLIPAMAGSPSPVDAAAAFERLKTLQGTWEGMEEGGKATTVFELVANGTALLERYSNPVLPDGGRMVSAYHLDGGTLFHTAWEHFAGGRRPFTTIGTFTRVK